MGSEPEYIRQTAEPDDIRNARDWFSRATDEAKTEGCTFFRATTDNDATMLLLEAWEKQPKDQGAPRWSVTNNGE